MAKFDPTDMSARMTVRITIGFQAGDSEPQETESEATYSGTLGELCERIPLVGAALEQFVQALPPAAKDAKA